MRYGVHMGQMSRQRDPHGEQSDESSGEHDA